jgi:uncharacterized OB-fold protein
MIAAASAPSTRSPGERRGLTAWRCASCERTSFPRRDRCPWCWSEQGAEVALPDEGEVHSFTTIHVGRPGTPTPYTVAYVDVGPVRLFARLEGEPRVGARGRIRTVAAADAPPESTPLVFDVIEEPPEDG